MTNSAYELAKAEVGTVEWENGCITHLGTFSFRPL